MSMEDRKEKNMKVISMKWGESEGIHSPNPDTGITFTEIMFLDDDRRAWFAGAVRNIGIWDVFLSEDTFF